MAIDEINQAQAEFWTAAGPVWAELRARFDAQANDHGLAAIDALALRPGESVIDIGCGTGTCTLQLAERVGPGGRVTGLDISPTMVEAAAAYVAAHGAAQVSFVVGDATVERFAGDADAVYSRFGLMFFSEPDKAFANILTALRPEGRLGFVCWQPPRDNPWASIPLTIAMRYANMPFGGDPGVPGPFSFGDPELVRSILDRAGFAGVAIEPRTARAHMGADMDDALDFLTKLAPPIAALEANDPDAAAAMRAEVAQALAEWVGPNGVEAPSAVWIVTARRA